MKSFLIFVEDEKGLFYHRDNPDKKFRMVGNRYTLDPIKIKAESEEEAYEKARDLPHMYGFYQIPEKDLFKKFHLERYR